MRWLLESLWSFLPLSGADRQVARACIRWQLSQQITWYAGMGKFHSIPWCKTLPLTHKSCYSVDLPTSCALESQLWVCACVDAARTFGSKLGLEAVPGRKQGRSDSCTSQGLMRVRTGPGKAMWLNLDLEGYLDPWWPMSKWHLPKRNTLQLRLINLL